MAQITKEPISASDAIKVVRLRVPAGMVVPEHHSNVDVIATIVSGDGNFSVEGNARAVRTGDVVVMKPMVRHAIEATTDLEFIVVHARTAPVGEAATCGA